MTYFTGPQFYSGGDAEVALLNKIASLLLEGVPYNVNNSKIVVTGASSSMLVTHSYETASGVEETLASDEIKELILDLREISLGDFGEPWYKMELEITTLGKAQVVYDRDFNPNISSEEQMFDLMYFPRSQALIPDWFLVSA